MISCNLHRYCKTKSYHLKKSYVLTFWVNIFVLTLLLCSAELFNFRFRKFLYYLEQTGLYLDKNMVIRKAKVCLCERGRDKGRERENKFYCCRTLETWAYLTLVFTIRVLKCRFWPKSVSYLVTRDKSDNPNFSASHLKFFFTIGKKIGQPQIYKWSSCLIRKQQVQNIAITYFILVLQHFAKKRKTGCFLLFI